MLLLDAYIFGDKYESEAFRTAVLLLWHGIELKLEAVTTLDEVATISQVVWKAFSNLPHKSRLCLSIVRGAAYTFVFDEWKESELPSSFWYEMTNVFDRSNIANGNSMYKPWLDNICEGRRHSDESAREECTINKLGKKSRDKHDT